MQLNKKYNDAQMPNEWVSPEEKKKNEWGLQAAKYIFFNHERGNGLFYNNRALHKKYRDYGMGKQSIEQYKPTLRVDDKNADKSHLGAIRWQIKNYATNLVNIAVSKIERRRYDPIAEPNDPMSIDEKEDFKAKLKSYIANKDFLQEIGVRLNGMFEEGNIPPELMPQNVSDVDISIEMNYKTTHSMRMEKAIVDSLNKNRYEEILDRIIDNELVKLGVAALHIRLDRGGQIQIEVLDASEVVVPASKTGDFSNIKYAGDFSWMSIDQLRILNTTLTDEEIKEIENEHTRGSLGSSFPEATNNSPHVDEQKVQVMRFEYRTSNEMVHLHKKDIGGNLRILEKPYKYQGDLKKKDDGRKIKRTPYYAVYEGYFVVGSEKIFNWKLKNNTEYREGPFGSAMLGYKIFAPNYYNGYITSLVAQMIPSLDSLQHYELKIQEYLATPFPDGVIIDHASLREVAHNMKDMEPKDLIEMAMQSKVFLTDSGTGHYGAGSSYKPVTSLGMGTGQIANYLQLIANELVTLERTIGMNQVTMAGTLSPEMGKGVAQLQEQASEVALDYLYKGKEYLFSEICKSIAILKIQAEKYGLSKNVSYKGIESHTYDIRVSVRPTSNEWAEFYAQAKEARAQGIITYSDMSMLRMITNLKQAYAYLSVVEKKRTQEMQMAKQQDIASNAQAQQASNEQTHNNNMELESLKGQMKLAEKEAELRLEGLKGENQLKVVEMKELMQRITDLEKIAAQGKIDSKLTDEKQMEERITKMTEIALKEEDKREVK